MGVRIVRHRDLVRTPWKNGGGTTAEIAVSPAGAGIVDFDWRVSMADVATEGPFSSFPGIDRTLTLIEGAALDLRVDENTHRLDADSRALSFLGEAATSATLPAGPIRDLNVMTRRSAYTHRIHGSASQALSGTILVIVALDDNVTIEVEHESRSLERLDTAIADPWPEAFELVGAAIFIALTAL